MKQIYYKYTLWEDYQNGMYNTEYNNENQLIENACSLLSNQTKFYTVLTDVIKNWVVATDVHLTNLNSNRQSWLGQAGCCYEFGAPEILTRKAWALLSTGIKINANLTANKIIDIYESNYRELHFGLGEQRLF